MLYSKNELTDQKAKALVWDITDSIKGQRVFEKRFEFIFVTAYLLLLSSQHNCESYLDTMKYIKNEIGEDQYLFIVDIVGKIDEDSLFEKLKSKNIETDVLLSILYQYFDAYNGFESEFSSTPYCISKLAVRILNIKNSDIVADFGCGYGGFLLEANQQANRANYYGVDINGYCKEISEIKAEIFIDHCKIEANDMFSVDKSYKFSKIFSNFPFGMRISNLGCGQNYLDALREKAPDIKNATSSDWIFNDLLLDHLKDDGNIVSIITNGSTWNSIDAKTREYFVENGYIACVIALPARLFSVTSIPVTLLVLNKKHNKKVRIIDASDLFTPGRRTNELSDTDIETIMKAMNKDSGISKKVDIETIRKNEYVISPSRYLENAKRFKDEQEFGSVIKHITRGAPLSAATLDQMNSNEPTNIQYLMLANIQNGIIGEDLPCLKKMDSKLEKYCIHKNNLLLSKNGAPYKVAVADFDEHRTVIGNGNLYIIELDEEKINPLYLKAFFESEDGVASLRRITVGSSMPNISANSLKHAMIPVPSMEEQLRIAERYAAKEDEIRVLRLKLQKAQNDIRSIFEEGE